MFWRQKRESPDQQKLVWGFPFFYKIYFDEYYAKEGAFCQQAMIKIKNLTKKYRNVTAVDNLNLEIRKQEIFGFLGPNGAGKTTTIRILSTLTLPTSGYVYINGYDVVKNPVQAKKEIGVIHQTHNIDPELTGFENLIIHGLLFKMKISEIKQKAEELLEFIDLKKDINKLADKYSGGMRRRLTIARALLHNPNLLIMDEPTAGLDVYTRKKIWRLIKRIRNEGSTVLLTTHYIEEAEYLSDRVGIIDKGKLIALGPPVELINKLGKVVIDIEDPQGPKIKFFNTREDAAKLLSGIDKNAIVRTTSLEDVFIKLTGKRVNPKSNQIEQ